MLEFSALDRNDSVVLVTLCCPNLAEHESMDDTQYSLRELRELIRTLGLTSVGEYCQKRSTLDSGTLLGRGKLEEIAREAKEDGAKALVFDLELTSGQVKNIKELTKLEVIDRHQVILEIFHRHARTNEAKLQIQVSKLEYLLPRLKSYWGHFSRQSGRLGSIGGEGEQQLELDRRMIRQKIYSMKRRLREIKKSKMVQKKRRIHQVLNVAIVGYTNAGKSSIMNQLCQDQQLVEDKLFATLDSTYRSLGPSSRPPIVLSDTVGFISNLPTTLVEGFYTTLESAIDADLLLLVVDVSDKNYQKHIRITQKILAELGVNDREILTVFNKKDLLQNEIIGKVLSAQYPQSLMVSSLDPLDMKKLRTTVIDHFLQKQAVYDLFIPYQFGDANGRVLSQTNIEKKVEHQDGIFYRIRVPKTHFERLGLKNYIMA